MSEEGGDRRGLDPVEILVGIAALFGASPVRLRWRLLAAQKRLGERVRGWQRRATHVGYAHRVCPGCGAVCDRTQRACHACGARLGSRTVELLARAGLSVAWPGSGTVLLAAVILCCYARQIYACPGHGFASFPSVCIVHAGGNVPALSLGVQPWRLGTSVLLHIGLWHLGFNLLALAQVGPTVEELFGRGRMLAWFFVTGVLGSAASAGWREAGVAAGASGALMGLIGIGAGWGFRDGTSIGRGFRDQMIKWAGYTLLFGWFLHADNAAHAGGLVSGLLLGFLASPSARLGGRAAPVNAIAGVIGLLALGAFAALVWVHTPSGGTSPFSSLLSG